MAKPYIITAIDIGSSAIKIAAVSKKRGEDEFKILSTNKASSLGIRRGVVIDSAKVAETISSLIQKTEEESGVKVRSALASIGGGHICSTSSKGLVSVSRADREISEEDIGRVLQAAKTIPIPMNQEIIHVFPREFIVDGENPVKRAVGMRGVRLEANVLALCAFSPYRRNSTQAILDSGLEIDDLIPTPLAASRAVLTNKEKELGVCLLDIGAGTTSMAVFEEGELIHATVFPVGSGHITNDIAICLKTDMETAEKVKLEFAACTSKKKKKIKVDGEELLEFDLKTLSDIVQARVSEIFSLASKELKSISKTGKLPAGVVLTGGGSKLPGIKDFAKKELKLPCRQATAENSSFEDDPSLSALWGLVLEGVELEEEEQNPSGIWSGFKRLLRIFLP